jgi:hypothetical protein
MDEQTRLLCLAHLKNGIKPAEAAERVGVSYGTALKLKKQLYEAEQRDKVRELFKLDKAALEILLDSVEKQLEPAIEAFGIGELVETESHELAESISGGSLLNKEFQTSASAIAKKITSVAAASNNADTILSLAKALCELQRAFFANETNSINNPAGIPLSSFEQHLRK